MSARPLAELRHVTKIYRAPAQRLFARGPEVYALEDVNFVVHRGESIAIVGESGSGKTTLAHQLLGLSAPTSGTVHFDGQPVDPRRDHLRWLRRRTGLVFQDPYTSFNPRRTIGQSVAEPLEAAEHPESADQRSARVRAMLTRVGLPEDAADRYPAEFSGGQRQRIAVARAVIHAPELLVGDEPVSALDVLVRARVIDLLAEIRAELALSMVTITHDLGIVPRLATRIVVMQGGRIVEDGATEHILHEPQHPYTRRLVASRIMLPPGTWRAGDA